jgi:hypothetical protein
MLHCRKPPANRICATLGTVAWTAGFVVHRSWTRVQVPPNSVAQIQYRLRAVPWEQPIRVPFSCSCDGKPLFGCRLCILMFGLRRGECTRLFADEAEARAHTTRHAGDFSALPAHTPEQQTSR